MSSIMDDIASDQMTEPTFLQHFCNGLAKNEGLTMDACREWMSSAIIHCYKSAQQGFVSKLGSSFADSFHLRPKTFNMQMSVTVDPTRLNREQCHGFLYQIMKDYVSHAHDFDDAQLSVSNILKIKGAIILLLLFILLVLCVFCIALLNRLQRDPDTADKSAQVDINKHDINKSMNQGREYYRLEKLLQRWRFVARLFAIEREEREAETSHHTRNRATPEIQDARNETRLHRRRNR